MKDKKRENVQQVTDDFELHFFTKDLVALMASSTKRKRKFKRQHVRNLLEDPYKNYDKLQDVSANVKAVSGNYFRILKYLSGLLTFDYLIYPIKSFDNKEDALKEYEKVAKHLKKMNIKYNFRWILEKGLENGEIYLYKLEDNKSIIYKEIPNQYCRISSMEDGVLLYEINLNKLNDTIIDSFPEEIQDAYKNKNNYKNGWYPVSNKGFAFNFIGFLEHGYPFLSFMFDDVMGLEDTKDLMENKNKLDAIKLIHQKIPLDKESKPVMDMDKAKIYHEATKKNLPDGVAVTTNPMEISAVPFDKTVTRDIDIIERAERSIWNSAGISDLIFNNNKASGEALKRSIIADETLVMPYLYLFANYINKEISNFKWNFMFLETSYFNREEKMKLAKENMAFGGSRLHFLSTCGFEPYDSINLIKFENTIDIDSIMRPKMTSHTMTNNDVGREKQDEVKEAGEKTREQK